MVKGFGRIADLAMLILLNKHPDAQWRASRRLLHKPRSELDPSLSEHFQRSGWELPHRDVSIGGALLATVDVP